MTDPTSDVEGQNQIFYTFHFYDPDAPRIVDGPRIREDYRFRFFTFDTIEDAKEGIRVYRKKCSEGKTEKPTRFKKMQIEAIELPPLDRATVIALMDARDGDDLIIRSEIIEVVD